MALRFAPMKANWEWVALGLAIRWALWVGVRVGLLFVALKLWPMVLLALALRLKVLPLAREALPRKAVDTLTTALAAALFVGVWLVPVDRLRAWLDAYGRGYQFFPLGPETRAAAAQAAPLVVLGGLILAGAWPFLHRLPGLSVLRRWGGDPPAAPGGGPRTTDHGQRRVVVRPMPAQRVATARVPAQPWFTEHLYGPGLLSLLVSPAGVGKTDLVNGTLAAARDGEAFAGRLTTQRPRRALVLSEMSGRTMRSGFRRWDFFTPPTGWLHALKLRLRPETFIDVLWAADLLAVRRDGTKPEWHEVVQALKPKLKRGHYDLLIVDSLGRWMGNDASNTQMLAALGLLRELIRECGIGVLVLHHCSKDDKPPYRPRGGTAIEAEFDIIWSLARVEGSPDPLHDPARTFECVKSRESEDAPPPLRIMRVLGNDWGQRPHYRLLGGAGVPPTPAQRVVVDIVGDGGPVPPPPQWVFTTDRALLPPPPPDPTDGLPAREAAVLAMVIRRGPSGATARFLADGPLLYWGPRAYKACCEALARLEKVGLVRQNGTEETPKGGPAARVFVATCVSDPADAVATAERILRNARKKP